MNSRAPAFASSAWQELGDDDLDRVCGGVEGGLTGYLRDFAVSGVKSVMEGGNPVTDTLNSFGGGIAKGWSGDTDTLQHAGENFVNGTIETAQHDAAGLMTLGAAAGPAIAAGLEYTSAYVAEAAPALAPFAGPLVETVGAIGLEAGGLEVGAVAGGAFIIHSLEGGVEAAHPAESIGEAIGYGAHAVYNEGATLAHEVSDWWNGTGTPAQGEAGAAGELSSVPGITLDNGGMDGFHGPDMNGDMGGIADHATDGMSGNADFNAGYHGSEDTFGTGGGDGMGHNGAGDESQYMTGYHGSEEGAAGGSEMGGYHGSEDMSGTGGGEGFGNGGAGDSSQYMSGYHGSEEGGGNADFNAGYHGSEDTFGTGGGEGFGNNGAGDSSSYAMDAGSHDMGGGGDFGGGGGMDSGGGGGMDSGGGGHDYSGSSDVSGSGGGAGFGNNGAGDSSSYMMDGGGGGGGGGGDVGMV